MSKVRCAYCHSNDGALGVCTHCGATHHPECYLENQKCAACGRDDTVVDIQLQRTLLSEFHEAWNKSGNAGFTPVERACLEILTKWILLHYRLERL